VEIQFLQSIFAGMKTPASRVATSRNVLLPVLIPRTVCKDAMQRVVIWNAKLTLIDAPKCVIIMMTARLHAMHRIAAYKFVVRKGAHRFATILNLVLKHVPGIVQRYAALA
jgi:hypothetical protein